MTIHSGVLVHAARALLTAACAFGIATASVQSPETMPGYSAASAEAERRAEAAAIALPSPASAGEHARVLSRELRGEEEAVMAVSAGEKGGSEFRWEEFGPTKEVEANRKSDPE